MNIRILKQDDWQAWKSLRLEALQIAPEAFASSFEEESNKSDEDVKSHLNKSTIFGVFIGTELVGCAGFYALEFLKMRHRGVLYGMYVQPEHRGKGIANQLVKAVINHAKLSVLQLHVTCVTSNPAAFQLYQKQGFISYGIEPRSLKIGDVYFDEYLMILQFS